MPRLVFPSVRSPAARRCALAPLLALAAAPRVGAQSLIVGIPNAEVTRPGKWFGTPESQFGAVNPRESWNSFTFVTYGVGRHTELAVSVLNVASPASGNRTVSAGFKTALPVAALLRDDDGSRLVEFAERWELTTTVGAMALQSLDRRGTGTWIFGPSWGTRQQFGSTKTSIMVGVEQPITRRVWLVGDWFSGTHDLAAAIPAVQFNLPNHLVVITGVKLPNPGATSGRRAFVLEIAKEF